MLLSYRDDEVCAVARPIADVFVDLGLGLSCGKHGPGNIELPGYC